MKRKYFPELTDNQLRDLLYRLHKVEQMSVNQMSKFLNVSRDTLYRWGMELGFEFRDSSSANRLRMQKMKAEERKALTRKANEAVRGSSRSEAMKLKVAASKSSRVSMSKHEKAFAHMLIDADLYDFIFSYPVNIFNIDFAFPAKKIAVEVDGGNWHKELRKREQDRKKEEFLASEGWSVMRWSNLDSSSQGTDLIALLRELVLG